MLPSEEHALEVMRPHVRLDSNQFQIVKLCVIYLKPVHEFEFAPAPWVEHTNGNRKFYRRKGMVAQLLMAVLIGRCVFVKGDHNDASTTLAPPAEGWFTSKPEVIGDDALWFEGKWEKLLTSKGLVRARGPSYKFVQQPAMNHHGSLPDGYARVLINFYSQKLFGIQLDVSLHPNHQTRQFYDLCRDMLQYALSGNNHEAAMRLLQYCDSRNIVINYQQALGLVTEPKN